MSYNPTGSVYFDADTRKGMICKLHREFSIIPIGCIPNPSTLTDLHFA